MVPPLAQKPRSIRKWPSEIAAVALSRPGLGDVVGDEEGHKRDCILTGLACAKQIENKKGPKCSHSNGGGNREKLGPSKQLNFYRIKT